MGEFGQAGDTHLLGESDHSIVGWVNLENEPGVVGDGGRIVGEPGAVGCSHLYHPGGRCGHQLGKAIGTADLDQLSSGDRDRSPGGQHRECQVQSGRVVVHHVSGFCAGQRPGQLSEVGSPAASGSRSQVEFEVGVGKGGLVGRPGCRGGQGRSAQIGVEQDAGRIDHPTGPGCGPRPASSSRASAAASPSPPRLICSRASATAVRATSVTSTRGRSEGRERARASTEGRSRSGMRNRIPVAVSSPA